MNWPPGGRLSHEKLPSGGHCASIRGAPLNQKSCPWLVSTVVMSGISPASAPGLRMSDLWPAPCGCMLGRGIHPPPQMHNFCVPDFYFVDKKGNKLLVKSVAFQINLRVQYLSTLVLRKKHKMPVTSNLDGNKVKWRCCIRPTSFYTWVYINSRGPVPRMHAQG